jgi:protein ImuA
VQPSPVPIARLRAQLAALAPPARHGVLALDGGAIDTALGGGLARGALHTVEGVGLEAETGAVPAAFLATLLARLADTRPLFWLAPTTDLYPPGLLTHGLDPARLIQLRTGDGDETLAAMETLLRSAAPSAVVAETGRVGKLAGRRLQLACLGSGVTGFLLRRWPYGRRPAEEITAAVTRWRLAPAPSTRDGRAPGPPRWQVELLHTRIGVPGHWIIEPEDRHDTPHPLRLAAGLADPPPATRRLAG